MKKLLFCLVLVLIGDAYAEFKETSPNIACDYLLKNGFSTRGWKNYYDNEYGCSTPYIDIGDSSNGWALKNNIAYYVEGTNVAVKQLKIVTNINNKMEAKKAHKQLLKVALALLKKIKVNNVPSTISDAIVNGHSTSTKIGSLKCEVIREDWPTGKGYSIKFIIK